MGKSNQKDYVEMQCRSCSVKYLRHKDTPYKTKCMVCFKKDKKIKLTDTDETLLFLWNKSEYQDKSIQKLKRELAIEKALSQTLKKRLRSARDVENASEKSSFLLPKDISKKLLLLCHPDKHEGNSLAHEVTQWILQKRK